MYVLVKHYATVYFISSLKFLFQCFFQIILWIVQTGFVFCLFLFLDDLFFLGPLQNKSF